MSSDHLIENKDKLNSVIKKHKKFLNDRNIFVFGIKPNTISDQYGYFISKKIKNLNQVSKFIEKPNLAKLNNYKKVDIGFRYVFEKRLFNK